MVRRITSYRGGRMTADIPHYSTASVIGSRQMRVRANVPCVASVCSSCWYSEG
jgi:hypothetical protein